LYEGGLRIPAIIRWPVKIEAGRISDELIISTDLYPTLAEVAGIEVGHSIEGLSLLKHLLLGEEVDRESLFWHYPHYHIGMPGGVIREGQYKLIEYFENGKLELYDLSADLGENSNLAEKLPKKAADMKQKLDVWRKSNQAQMPTSNPGYQAN
jgi:arylsulfatase A-like enzyme